MHDTRYSLLKIILNLIIFTDYAGYNLWACVTYQIFSFYAVLQELLVCTCYDIIFQSTLERPDNINAM